MQKYYYFYRDPQQVHVDGIGTCSNILHGMDPDQVADALSMSPLAGNHPLTCVLARQLYERREIACDALANYLEAMIRLHCRRENGGYKHHQTRVDIFERALEWCNEATRCGGYEIILIDPFDADMAKQRWNGPSPAVQKYHETMARRAYTKHQIDKFV